MLTLLLQSGLITQDEYLQLHNEELNDHNSNS